MNNNNTNNNNRISIVDELKNSKHEGKKWQYVGTIFGECGNPDDPYNDPWIAESKQLSEEIEELLKIVDSENDFMIDHPTNSNSDESGYYFQSGNIYYKSGSLINEMVFDLMEE